MSSSLDTWVADADSLRYADRLGLKDRPAYSEYVVGREEDYFLSLTGALFDRLRQDDAPTVDWELLGNAFAEFTFFGDSPAREVPRDTTLYSAAAFYMGGFSASARLMLSSFSNQELEDGYRAPSLSTSGETLSIKELLTLRARTEHAGHAGQQNEWSSPEC